MSRLANFDRLLDPKDKNSGSVSARFPIEVFTRIYEIASKEERSLNYVVNELVALGLEHRV